MPEEASLDYLVPRQDLPKRYHRSPTTIWRWEQKGILPPADTRINGREYWRLATLRAFEERNRPDADAA